MKYKDYYKHLHEAEVPFASADIIQKGLRGKYGTEELEAYTFGIELEYVPGDQDDDVEYDWNEISQALYQDPDVLSDYEEHIEHERNRIERRWNGNVDDWDDAYGPVDVDTFKKNNSEPERNNYDDEDAFINAHDEWKDNVRDVERRYDRWRSNDYYDNLGDFISDLDATDYLDLDDYMISSSNSEGINDAINYISNKMNQDVVSGDGCGENRWAVGTDGDFIEIRSKHLKQTEFDLVRQICDYVSDNFTSGKSSAHVHIGLPKDFDSFDLLAITTLVDESAIKDAVGPSRALDDFAKLRKSLHNKIIYSIYGKSKEGDKIDKSFFMTNDTLRQSLLFIDRNHGTNVASMSVNGTIEFRYFGSTITNRFETFIKWIKYFLLLPKIAKSRNKIVLKKDYVEKEFNQNLIAVRESGGVRFYVDRKGPTLNKPAPEIKKGIAGSPIAAKIKQRNIDRINQIRI
jgi:hypothetical protein